MKKLPPPKPIAFRLTIGVTGHRALRNVSQLQAAVQQALDDIAARYHCDGIELKLCVLTPLAEGADRLVAKEVLKRDPDAEIKVVLPLTIADYIEDFATQESREAFHSLLEKARSPLSLRTRNIGDDYPPELQQEARRNAYEDVGRFVVNHCDVLLALWDEKNSDCPGGTGQIVHYAQDQQCPLYIINTEEPEKCSFAAQACAIEEAQKKIISFNRLVCSKSVPEKAAAAARTELYPAEASEAAQQLPAGALEQALAYFIPYYVAVSVRSGNYQSIYKKAGLYAFWFNFIVIILSACGAVFGSSFHQLIYVKLYIIATANALIFFANRVRSHRRWTEYRFIAERLRCLFYQGITGIEPQPLHVRRRGEGTEDTAAWMVAAVEEIWSGMPREPFLHRIDSPASGAYVVQALLDGQIRYHKNSSKKNSLKSRRLEAAGQVVSYLLLGAVLLLIAGMADARFFGLDLAAMGKSLKPYLYVCMLALPALASTTEAIRSHRQYKHLALRSTKMAYELEVLKTRFRLLTPAKLEYLMHGLDGLMLQETQDWMALMSFSELHKAV